MSKIWKRDLHNAVNLWRAGLFVATDSAESCAALSHAVKNETLHCTRKFEVHWLSSNSICSSKHRHIAISLKFLWHHRLNFSGKNVSSELGTVASDLGDGKKHTRGWAAGRKFLRK